LGKAHGGSAQEIERGVRESYRRGLLDEERRAWAVRERMRERQETRERESGPSIIIPLPSLAGPEAPSVAGEGSSDEPRLPGHRYADRAETTDPGVVSANLRAVGSPRSDDHRPPRGTGRVRIAFEHSLDGEPGDPEANRDVCRILAPRRPLADIAAEAYGFLT